MKKKIFALLISICMFGLNCLPVSATYTYVSTKSGGGKHEALYYENSTTRIDPMSNWYEFGSGGGVLTYKSLNTTTTSFSATAKAGALWKVANIEASISSKYKNTKTAEVGVQWNIKPYKRARVVTKWYKRNAKVLVYNNDNQLLETKISTPARNTSAIAIQEQNI